MKIKVQEFANELQNILAESIENDFPKLMEDKEFCTLCENASKSVTDDDIDLENEINEGVIHFTAGVYEGLGVKDKERLDEIAFLAPWIAKAAAFVLRRILPKLIKRFGGRFMKTGIFKKLCKRYGSKTVGNLLKKMNLGKLPTNNGMLPKGLNKFAGNKAATSRLTNITNKMGNWYHKNLNKPAPGANMVSKVTNWTNKGSKPAQFAKKAAVGTAVTMPFTGMGGNKNNANTGGWDNYDASGESYYGEAIDRVFKRHFSE